MFFGMIRQSCHGSGHPTANQFLYAYRLLLVKSLIKPSQGVSVKTDPVQLLGCIKALGRHCQTSACRTELIEQHIDAMLQQDVTGPEADDMDLVLSVDNISNNSLPEKVILSYLGGYVAHKLQRFSSCFDYVQLLTDTSSTCYSGPDTKVVKMKSWGRVSAFLGSDEVTGVSRTVCPEPCSTTMCRHIH